MIGVPRIQGKVGQCDQSNDPTHIGKWFFTIWVTIMGSGESQEYGPIGPWETEIIAKKELEKCSEMLCDMVAKGIPGGIPGQYIDMKDNKLKKWKP